MIPYDLTHDDLSDLPQAVLEQLSTRLKPKPTKDEQILAIINKQGGTASIDQMLIDLYREDKKVTTRNAVIGRLNRLKNRHLVKNDEQIDIYSVV